MYLTLLNYTLKNSYDDKFYAKFVIKILYFTTIKKTQETKDKYKGNLMLKL